MPALCLGSDSQVNGSPPSSSSTSVPSPKSEPSKPSLLSQFLLNRKEQVVNKQVFFVTALLNACFHDFKLSVYVTMSFVAARDVLNLTANLAGSLYCVAISNVFFVFVFQVKGFLARRVLIMYLFNKVGTLADL